MVIKKSTHNSFAENDMRFARPIAGCNKADISSPFQKMIMKNDFSNRSRFQTIAMLARLRKIKQIAQSHRHHRKISAIHRLQLIHHGFPTRN